MASLSVSSSKTASAASRVNASRDPADPAGSNVFKVVGPVLFKQDLDDVKENVNKRLESPRRVCAGSYFLRRASERLSIGAGLSKPRSRRSMRK